MRNIGIISGCEADGVILGISYLGFLSFEIVKPFVDCLGIWK